MHYKVKHDTVKIKEEKHNSHDLTSVRLVSFSFITFCIQMFSTINPPPLIKEKLLCTTLSPSLTPSALILAVSLAASY